MKRIIYSALAASLVFSSTSALAQSKTLSMEEIQAQLQKLSSQVEELSTIVAEQDKIIKQQNVALEAHKTKSAKVKTHKSEGNAIIITQDPTPKFETADGQFSFQPLGRVHFDTTFFDNDLSENSNYSNIRRGRIGFKGKLGEDFKYLTEIDFAEDESDIQDMTVTYTGLDEVNITVGHHRPPVGFERNTSSNHNMIIERAVATNLFASNRKLGASISTKAEDYIVAVGVYNQDAGGGSDNQPGDDLSIDSRAAANVLGLLDIDEENILHVGLGYSYQDPSDDVRYRARPGIADGARYIDTGVIDDVETINIVTAELVGVFDSFSFQSEYFHSSVDQQSADADFSGYYVQAGYFLTGETRNYNRKTGLFGRTRVLEDFNLNNGGVGAWEVMARFDSTDLNDPGAGISGGALDLYTLGINWYLRKNVRLMGNVILVDSDENAATAPNDDPTIFKIRAQWDF